jgi:hypothetical protein
VPDRGWKRAFDDPAARRLRARHARGCRYITKLPKAEHKAPEWQAPMEALILVAAKGGSTMLARIGMLRALNRHHVREFNSDRKPPSLGRRKLAREQ